ncbi:hypothetical protein BGX38DRAFT_569158 [Terfezia claveryi]|nr:hypothetical protein BGX38DRAFT_569158 [Terfezia claveryi]
MTSVSVGGFFFLLRSTSFLAFSDSSCALQRPPIKQLVASSSIYNEPIDPKAKHLGCNVTQTYIPMIIYLHTYIHTYIPSTLVGTSAT